MPRARSAEDAVDAAAAMAAAGATAMRWTVVPDVIALDGEAGALGLSGLIGATWAQFVAGFVAPDRPRVDALRLHGGVTTARVSAGGDRSVRVRLRLARPRDGTDGLVGLIFPAFGAPDEAEDDGSVSEELALRDAADRLDFEAWFQPVVAVCAERVAGFEALIRWPHAERGVLSPEDFLPLAEELNLVARIGRWMRSEAAEQARRWRDGCSFVSVNVTSGELESEDLVDQVAALVREHDLAAGQLKIEVTESQVMRDPDRAARTLTALKSAGVSLALDDFGAGFSSLSWLGRFPFDTVKIDRYFITTLHGSATSRAIVDAVIKLAHDLGMTVVAEGVETADTARRLADLGCDYAQGFRFAPALPARAATRYLMRHTALRHDQP